MTATTSIDRRLAIISRNLSALDGIDEIRELLLAGKTPKGFWATAPTGKPHIAYFVPLLKLADFAKAGLKITVLACDIYAFLVNYKHPMELVAHRTAYYRHMIKGVLHILGVPENRIDFIEASSYELTKEFMLDSYKLAALTEEKEVRNTGDEYRNSTKLSVLLCPGLPALAEEYLDSDFQFGGEDQAGLFQFNERFLPQLGYRKRAHLMNPLVPGLQGTKMSSSVPDSKIEFLDTFEEVHRKVSIASCKDGQVEGNGVLSVLYHIVIPIRNSQMENLVRDPEHGILQAEVKGSGIKVFKSYDEVLDAFVAKELSASSLKHAVATSICEILAPLRKLYENNEEWQLTEKLAYPEE